jgi:hypothetical protein
MSKIGRGKHTTRTVTLIQLPGGGLLADTPGFNMPALDRVAAVDLAAMFPEFRSRVEAQPCRFDNCQHVLEPGCSINTLDLERCVRARRMCWLARCCWSPGPLAPCQPPSPPCSPAPGLEVPRRRAPTAPPPAPSRYEYYLKLMAEVRTREEQDVRALQLAKRRREGSTKVKAEAGGRVRHEVRLESKKHRVVSRRRAKQGLLGDLEGEGGW